jgi:hypothetical protein
MVFLSYAREDRFVAIKLAHVLAHEGIDCVLDPELIEGDPFWREAVSRCFADCELMVGVVSAHALASPWVEQEQRAFAGRKLWLAGDTRISVHEASAMGADRLIPLDEAPGAIRRSLPRSHQRPGHGSNALAPSRTEERVARALEAEAKLAAFRTLVPRLPRPKLDFAGDVACIGDGFLKLRRIATTTTRDTWIGILPVSNAQYRAFLALADVPAPTTWGRTGFRVDDAPVTGVSWFEACAFALWVRGSLPTEAEWVQAARGNDPVRAYATATGEVGEHLAYFGRPFGASPPVAATAHPPNSEGYHGMCGNTWDWCATTWGSHRVIRGGGSMDAARFCAIRSRYRNAPIDRDCCVGFRVKIETATTCSKGEEIAS